PRTPTPATSPLSLHDALPIFGGEHAAVLVECDVADGRGIIQLDVMLAREFQFLLGLDERGRLGLRLLVLQFQVFSQPLNFRQQLDRKSTRLNSSHRTNSYAVF